MNKKQLTKKMKWLICSAATLTLVPLVAVSAVACAKEPTPKPTITISTQPQSQTIYLNQTQNLPTLFINVTTSDANAQLTYQWYENDTNSTTNGKIIDGATEATYMIPKSYAQKVGTKYFYVEISETQNGNILSTLKSNIASLTIKSKTSISISSQPQNQIAIINQTIKLPTFSVAVNNIEGADLKYQWYSNVTGSLVNWNIVPGATKAFYTVPADQITTVKVENYRVEITGSLNGVLLEPITSNIASLIVDEKPVIKISEEPTAKTVSAGETENLPTFSVVVKPILDAVFTYQWYSTTSADENTGGTIIANATKSSYTVPSIDVSSVTTKYFYVVIGGTINGVQLDLVTSSVATLTVTAKS